jgi:hypothetical protein
MYEKYPDPEGIIAACFHTEDSRYAPLCVMTGYDTHLVRGYMGFGKTCCFHLHDRSEHVLPTYQKTTSYKIIFLVMIHFFFIALGIC